MSRPKNLRPSGRREVRPVKWKCGCVYDHHKDPYYFPCGKDDCEITKSLENVENNPLYVTEMIVYGEKKEANIKNCNTKI